MKKYLLLLCTIVISGCCNYNKKELEFNSKELSHFSDYKIGDTIYFESNLNDLDTFMIVGFRTELNENCGGFMVPKPGSSKWVQIKHLPVDRWFGTSQDMTTGGKIDTIYQELFWISKNPIEKQINYSISFKDFYSTFDSIIGESHSDTIQLGELKISNYYVVKHSYPEKINEPKNIETVYWTDKLGLTAYRSKDGEIWTKKIGF